ncbi:TetR/AcrR family transcriptional regulator [Stappia sp. WLB 29]|uniref:TetR/AcrR family transcriptional regulator n=1 Tax=Stappia sp. WLB 29 TaxID=2925220 RepID=UPI0020BFD5AE|nr:TetR/AcrR family transcriptional regulator [Stappia sp. WLB 29]
MRVSRMQAERNRQKVIDVASRLFREHGFDGIGLKDLMKNAGLTQGAFYKQFASKDDLAAQASRRAFESASCRWSSAIEANPGNPLEAVLDFYLSTDHLEERMDGCPIVALGSDAARQGSAVKESFEAGIKTHLEVLDHLVGQEETGGRAMSVLSTMVGALILSRAIDDTQLSRQILKAAADSVRQAVAVDGGAGGSLQ